MKKFALAVAIAATGVSAPAMAQDTDLGGPFIGVVGGYDLVSLEIDSLNDTTRDDGLLYGVTAGYDIDTGTGIIGIEAEASGTTLSDDIADAGLDLYGGVRAGLQIDEVGMVYGKVGYSTVDIDLEDNLDGIRLGAGYERRFGGFFGRLEYRYTTYDVSDTIDDDLNGNRNQIVLVLGGKF